MQVKKSLFSGAVIIAYSLFSNIVLADFETESNNNFASRNTFGPGVLIVNGSLEAINDLSQLTPDFTFTGPLQSGLTNFHTQPSLTAGTLFFGAIDNSASGVDTFLGTFDEFDSLIDTNDDGSPFGDGLADALGGTVNSDGSIRFGVTGCCDNFDDTHTESGDYDLFVYLGFDQLGNGDVDFLSFEGLTPGTVMKAEITSADFDTTLGLFDNAGSLIESDDDGGFDVLSLLNVVVPVDGILTFAVSGFSDFDFIPGSHDQIGDYQLTLTAVPVPAALWLFGSSMLGLIGLGHRKHQAIGIS